MKVHIKAFRIINVVLLTGNASGSLVPRKSSDVRILRLYRVHRTEHLNMWLTLEAINEVMCSVMETSENVGGAWATLRTPYDDSRTKSFTVSINPSTKHLIEHSGKDQAINLA